MINILFAGAGRPVMRSTSASRKHKHLTKPPQEWCEQVSGTRKVLC